jgi:penicillin-binding protein 2
VSRLIEAHSARNPRLLFFHGVIAGIVLLLVGGLAYRQLFKTSLYSTRERLQNQRRIIIPGPRGNIYDRENRVLVGNRPRFSVVLDLAELRGEFRSEYRKIARNYSAMDRGDRPNSDQLERLARSSVAQHYLDQVNFILGRNEKVRIPELNRHITQTLLLPYVLLDDLAPEEYARLIERLPVNSPLQVYTSSTRYYPYNSAAAHTLGFIGANSDTGGDDFGEEGLRTFEVKGSIGRTGLEKVYDDFLQGEAGGAIYIVDPAGFKVGKPDQRRLPVQGHNLTTSIDIDLQLAAEDIIGDRTGAAVALDVHTGEVLVLASKPDYDLNSFVPRLTNQQAQKIEEEGAWLNQAISGAYPPGSTFKIITSIAGLRSGRITPDQFVADCTGQMMVGNRMLHCDNGLGHHGDDRLAKAIADSCDVYFWTAGLIISPEIIAAEARRFHLDQRTGIELAGETSRMVIPDPDWKQRTQEDKRWYPGDTANMAIGQGYVLVTPLEMACFAASVARNETYTKPTLLHNPQAPVQHTEPIGLTPAQRATLVEGMEGCTTYGTASLLTTIASERIPGVRVAGKTGTAQKRVRQGDKIGTINCAWFICFAPSENPEIAVAVMIEGDTIGENYGGGRNAAPVANAILKKYFEKKNRPPEQPVKFKVE